MKSIVTALISQQIKTNLQREADTKGITLSKLIYKILKQYEQTNLSRETTKVAPKGNNTTSTSKGSTKKTDNI
jgi:hypothetical protein